MKRNILEYKNINFNFTKGKIRKRLEDNKIYSILEEEIKNIKWNKNNKIDFCILTNNFILYWFISRKYKKNFLKKENIKLGMKYIEPN